ncbi:phytoene dehydrogenase [Halobacteriales archaeon QS_1_67_19]|nr:MAG: phytoene dehydrogenase [Halobacteriales archaeon QS_1_67_19]
MTATVAILGGGIGGLSAAHELAERGFDVAVYEQRDRFGGKARSVPVPDSGGDGRPLPGEHGFRFFPGFYRHVTDTMARIPYADNDRGVADNLVSTSQMLLASGDGGVTLPTETPGSVRAWRELLTSMFARDQVPGEESNFFVDRMLTFLSSSATRRESEYEHTPWWEFIDAEHRSRAFRQYIGYGITQSLVAMRPQVSSTRTIGRIYVQMLRGLFDPSIDADALLNGPTNEVWIDPWVDYLDSLGADLHPGTEVRRVHCDGRRVTGVTIDDGREREIAADYYVAAVPVEGLCHLLTDDLRRAAPSLRGVERLDTAWMNGLQFYLTEDVPTAAGHVVYYDSPWALTSISQRQFWDDDAFDLTECADGEVAGVLSVIVSDWESPGVVYDKPARECTPEEIRAEVWIQMKRHLGDELRAEAVADWFLDPAIEHTDDGVVNREPLLINTAGSLRHRPDAATEIPNLTLAADYVRTETDLACMESANEAARRATNAIIERSGADVPTCDLWEFREPAVFEPLKRLDAVRHRFGRPHPGEMSKPLWRTALNARSALRF